MRQKYSVIPASTGIISSLLAFLGIISCCAFPILAAVLAWFGIGATQLNFFADYQYYFLAFAAMSLIYGFYIVYLKNSESDCCNVQNSKRKSKLLSKIFLWIGLVAIITVFVYSFYNSPSKNEDSDLPIINLLETE
jgi:nitrate reductase NapE component